MKESQLWKLIKENMPEVHWQRIESGSTVRGIPDLNGCYNGIEVWIELKQGTPKLSPYQVNWIRKRAEAGGRVSVMTTTKDHLLVWHIGKHFVDMRLDEQALSICFARTGAKPEHWQELRDLIFT